MDKPTGYYRKYFKGVYKIRKFNGTRRQPLGHKLTVTSKIPYYVMHSLQSTMSSDPVVLKIKATKL